MVETVRMIDECMNDFLSVDQVGAQMAFRNTRDLCYDTNIKLYSCILSVDMLTTEYNPVWSTNPLPLAVASFESPSGISALL
jgi:hypothetical protein